MIYKDIIFEKTETTAWLTLNKPQVMNALGKRTLLELLSALEDIENESTIAITVIRGAGGNFCTGMDKRELNNFNKSERSEFTQIADKVFLKIAKFKKITLAVISGYCLAGGLELALGCDLIIAEEKCKIGDGHINLPGFVPNGGASFQLPRIIGPRKAKELLLVGDFISGKEAEKIGLVNYAVPEAQLEQLLNTIVNKIADKSPIGLEYMKKLINSNLNSDLESSLLMEHLAVNYLNTTEDYSEIITAMQQNRKPLFKGK